MFMCFRLSSSLFFCEYAWKMSCIYEGNCNPHWFVKYSRIRVEPELLSVRAERRGCFESQAVVVKGPAGAVIKGQRMTLKQDVSAPASHSPSLIYSVQAPSSPSSPSANEPKYEKRWLDAVSLPLFMARISRRKAGTDKLRYGNPPWCRTSCKVCPVLVLQAFFI